MNEKSFLKQIRRGSNPDSSFATQDKKFDLMQRIKLSIPTKKNK